MGGNYFILFERKMACLVFACAFFVFAYKPVYSAKPVKNQAIIYNVDSLKNLLLTNIPDSLRVIFYHEIAVSIRFQDVEESLRYANLALNLANEINYKHGKGLALGTIGLDYEMKMDSQKSIFYFLQALRIFEEEKNTDRQAALLNNIGLIYLWQKNYILARNYFEESLKLSIGLNLKDRYPIFHINLGIVYSELNQTDLAIVHFQKGVALAMENNNSDIIALALINLGEVNLKINKVNKAKEYYLEAIKYTNLANYIIPCYSGLGDVFIREHNYPRAKKYLLRALSLVKKSGLIQSAYTIHKNLALVYEKQGDYKTSYAHASQSHALKASTFNENSSKKINAIQTKYQIEKRDKEIELLNRLNEAEKARSDNRKITQYFFLGCFILALVFSLILFRNILLKKRMNKILSGNNTKLSNEKAQAEYEILKGKVNPQFLFNSLKALDIIVQKNQEEAIEFIESFADIYRMVLETGDIALISLADELKILEQYLYLQEKVFGNNLQVSLALKAQSKALFIPPFAIQMSVENIIVNSSISTTNKLHLSIRTTESFILIEGFQLTRNENQINDAYKNIIERYKLITHVYPEFTEQVGKYYIRLPLLPPNNTVQHNMKTA